MTLSEMRRLLDAQGLQLTKSLGQNFLHDRHQLQRIVSAAELTAADRVLEIGPGLGPLTTELLAAGVQEVLAIEKDERLLPLLQARFPGDERLTLRNADALKVLQTETRDWAGWKLVANLPYSVGSPILVELALTDSPPDRLVATLQLEVIQRIRAQTDTDDYGLLTLLLAVSYEPGLWFKIPRDCFFPVPTVDSACLVLKRRAQPLLPRALVPEYVRVVKLAFSQRRKMMFKLLKQQWPPEVLTRAFTTVGIDLMERAEKVTAAQFAHLTRTLTNG